MKFDVIVIGGGSAGLEAAFAQCRDGRRTALIAKGRSLEDIDYGPFVRAGGILMLGDCVTEGVIDEGRVTHVRTENLGRTELTADLYVLATGKFFGGGLVADMSGVREPLFGLDVKYTEGN